MANSSVYVQYKEFYFNKPKREDKNEINTDSKDEKNKAIYISLLSITKNQSVSSKNAPSNSIIDLVNENN